MTTADACEVARIGQKGCGTLLARSALMEGTSQERAASTVANELCRATIGDTAPAARIREESHVLAFAPATAPSNRPVRSIDPRSRRPGRIVFDPRYDWTEDGEWIVEVATGRLIDRNHWGEELRRLRASGDALALTPR